MVVRTADATRCPNCGEALAYPPYGVVCPNCETTGQPRSRRDQDDGHLLMGVLLDEISDLEYAIRCAAAGRRLTHEVCGTIRALVQQAMAELGRE